MAKSLIEAGEMEDRPLINPSDEMEWDIYITNSDIKVLKMYEELMSPFAKQTDILGAEHYSTVHLVFPALTELLAHLEEMWAKFDSLGEAGAANYCKDLEEEFKRYFDFFSRARV